jgi:hypothetical protein
MLDAGCRFLSDMVSWRIAFATAAVERFVAHDRTTFLSLSRSEALTDVMEPLTSERRTTRESETLYIPSPHEMSWIGAWFLTTPTPAFFIGPAREPDSIDAISL